MCLTLHSGWWGLTVHVRFDSTICGAISYYSPLIPDSDDCSSPRSYNRTLHLWETWELNSFLSWAERSQPTVDFSLLIRRTVITGLPLQLTQLRVQMQLYASISEHFKCTTSAVSLSSHQPVNTEKSQWGESCVLQLFSHLGLHLNVPKVASLGLNLSLRAKVCRIHSAALWLTMCPVMSVPPLQAPTEWKDHINLRNTHHGA